MLQKSTYDIPIDGQVYLVEASHYPHCDSVVAVATDNRIYLLQLIFNEPSDTPDHVLLKVYQHECTPTAICWHPDVNLSPSYGSLSFATGGADGNIRLFNVKQQDEGIDSQLMLLQGHKGYINSIAFEPSQGDYIASVSEDFTCLISSVDGKSKKNLPLGTAGVCVQWTKGRDGSKQVIVALRDGVVRIIDAASGQPIRALQIRGNFNLVSIVDLALHPDRNGEIACIAGGNIFVWDSNRSSLAKQITESHTDTCKYISWCPSHTNYVATYNHPANQLKVHNIRTGKVAHAESIPVVGGLSFYRNLPWLCVGSDNCLKIIKLSLL